MSVTILLVCRNVVARNSSTRWFWLNARMGILQYIAFVTPCLTTSRILSTNDSMFKNCIACLDLFPNITKGRVRTAVPSSIRIWLLKQLMGLSTVSMVYESENSLCIVAISDRRSVFKALRACLDSASAT